MEISAIEAYEVEVHEDLVYGSKTLQPSEMSRNKRLAQINCCTKGLAQHNTGWGSKKGEEVELRGDGYIPKNDAKEGSKMPVILLIHGGGFQAGTKSAPEIVDAARYFASRGFAVLSIDYSLGPAESLVPKDWDEHGKKFFTNADGSLNEWAYKQLRPAFTGARDARLALRFLADNSEKFNLDMGRVTVLGESAGAALATTTGLASGRDFFECDIALSGDRKELKQKVHTVVCLWGTPLVWEVYASYKGKKEYSINKESPSILAIHGKEDRTIPYTESKRFIAEYEKQGGKSDLWIIDQGIDQDHEAWWAVSNEGMGICDCALNFIAKCQNLEICTTLTLIIPGTKDP
eukprot:jgi/Bigna1/130682/aug1.12_g5390